MTSNIAKASGAMQAHGRYPGQVIKRYSSGIRLLRLKNSRSDLICLQAGFRWRDFDHDQQITPQRAQTD